MNGIAFFFLSLLLRLFVLAAGLVAMTIFGSYLSEVIWPSKYFAAGFTAMKGLPGPGALRLAAGAFFGLLFLASAAVAGFGAWLIYKRLRGGVQSTQYNPPETLVGRLVSMVVFGFAGILFSYLLIAYLISFSKIFYMHTYAAQSSAVITAKDSVFDAENNTFRKELSFKVQLPDGSDVLAETSVPVLLFNTADIGDTIDVLFWPDSPAEAKPSAVYSLGNMIPYFIFTVLFFGLALVGISCFWACLTAGRTPPAAKTASVSPTPVRASSSRTQFGRR